VSLISRLRAVVAGDDFLDSDFDELDYETSDDFENFNRVGSQQSIGRTVRP
jgi:cell division inhibitor SepF